MIVCTHRPGRRGPVNVSPRVVRPGFFHRADPWGRAVAEGAKRFPLAWLLAVCLALAVSVFAGGTSYAVTGASTPATLVLGDILGKTEAHYQQLHAFTADFRQSTTSAATGGMVLAEARGRLYYQKLRQMRWEYDEPEKQIFVANQQLAWLQVPSERQITLFDAKAIFSSPFVRTFFDGVVELRKHFEVNLDSRMSSKDAAVLKLTPLVEDPNVKALFLWIDLNSHEITVIESRDAVGNVNRIVLESQKSAPQLDAILFQLNVPAGFIVLDAEGRELKGPDIEKLKEKMKP